MPAPALSAVLAFVFLFWQPLTSLARDWWADPDAGHGLLLVPLAAWLAWRRGWVAEPRPQPVLGLALLVAAIGLRYLGALAAEVFSQRLAMLGAAGALLVHAQGTRQLVHWWLPGLLVVLSVPLPDVLVGTLAFPLQLQASAMGAAMLETRHVPVLLAGNVIHLPGRSLFVTEACSGLRSLTALLALGVLIGGLWLRSPWSRAVLTVAAIPVAMVLNAVRVFLTGFLVFYVDPALAEGVMHYTEGWAIFVVAFAILAVAAVLVRRVEAAFLPRRA